MDSNLIKLYFETKIKTQDEIIEANEGDKDVDYIIYRQGVFKEILEDLKKLNGGEL